VQAFRLQQQLSEAVDRRDEWREKDKETPQEERERLLQQVKADNQEIGSIEKMLEWRGGGLWIFQNIICNCMGTVYGIQLNTWHNCLYSLLGKPW
jgi:hypothetical protein